MRTLIQEVSESSGEQDLAPQLGQSDLVRIYQEQFRHLRHVDIIDYCLFLFASLVALILMLVDLAVVPGREDAFHSLFLHLFVLALAMGAGHILVYNAGAAWRRYVVLTKVETALRLYQSGAVPFAFRFFAPQDFWSFAWRLFLSHRGPFLVVYLLAGAYVSLELAELWFPPPGWPYQPVAVLFPMLLLFLLLIVNYRQVRSLLLSARQEAEASQAANLADKADRFVAVGESLMLLSPPRAGDALRQFQKALELVPDHPEAKGWVERLQAGRA